MDEHTSIASHGCLISFFLSKEPLFLTFHVAQQIDANRTPSKHMPHSCQNCFNPATKLLVAVGFSISPKTGSNNSTCHSSQHNQRKMIRSFLLITEITRWVSLPFSFQHIIFSQNSHMQPHKNLIFCRTLAFQFCFRFFSPIILGQMLINRFH